MVLDVACVRTNVLLIETFGLWKFKSTRYLRLDKMSVQHGLWAEADMDGSGRVRPIGKRRGVIHFIVHGKNILSIYQISPSIVSSFRWFSFDQPIIRRSSSIGVVSKYIFYEKQTADQTEQHGLS